VARYNGAENSGDWANAIALDTSGNVYVTGTSSTGTEQDYATVKYAPDGTQLWVARYNGPGNSTDAARAIALDTSGNVYVTGESDGGGTGEDYATIKYAPDGTQLWVARYNGPENSADRAYAIAVDTSGNVYVTGPSWGGHPYYGGTSYDYATVKYDTDGNEKWVRRYNGPANYGDEARAIAIDSSDNVYVTGTSSTVTEQDYATVKYAPDGTELWVARYDGQENSNDGAHAIAVDSWGNVYVTGQSDGSGTGSDYATIKYAPDGTQLWVARYDGPGNARDRAFAIAVDSSSNVYVTGMSYGSGTDQDYATVKYKQTYTDGSVEVTEEWVARYNGPGNSWDYATELALDSSGNVYVAGGSVGSGVVNDYATVKYDADTGQQLWVARYDSPRNYTDVACAIAVDSSGKVYVTGYSAGIGTDWDYATIKYSQIPTQPPVAVCQDVTVMADSYCEGVVAPEDVDNGSSDPDGDPVTLSLSPEGPYPIGTTAVTLTVTDDQGASSACTATVKVLTASEGTLQLVAKVMVLNLQNGIENSLDTKLDAALQALDDLNTNNDVAAINAIEAFINHVQAQSGNQISEADADDLIDTANKIIVGLQNGCY
jgi:uncharacterized delta-60 repeat protein